MAVIISGNNTPTAGSVIYGDGTTLTPTATGTAGQVLTSNGSSAPTWGSAGALTLVGTYTPTSSATVDLAFTGGYTSYMIIATGIKYAGNALVTWTADNFATTASFQIVGFGAIIPGGGSAFNGTLSSGNYFLGTGIYTPGNNRINFNITAGNVSSTTQYKSYTGTVGGAVDFLGYNREMAGFLTAYSFSNGVTTAINGLRFSSTSGASAAYSGVFKVYGIS